MQKNGIRSLSRIYPGLLGLIDMQKDFQVWHNKKSHIDKISKRPFFHEREIWSCSLGVNVGFEQDGRGEDFLRPVIVLLKFNHEVFWAIPLTHTNKESRFYFSFPFSDTETSVALLSQIRLVDARRLSHKIGEISEENFIILKQKLRNLLS